MTVNSFSANSMDLSNYNTLPLRDKAELIQKKGNFIEGEDFYSFKILLYTFEDHQVEITYDYTGSLISVEFVEEKESRHGHELPSKLDDILQDPDA